MRILLVEDDKNLSAVIAEQLHAADYLVDCCYNGESALLYVLNGTFSYDIILLDRMLPIVDGLSVLKILRQKQIWIPVLMITALGEVDDKIDGLDCGADDYLVKPFHLKEMLARIRALTRRPSDIIEKHILSAYDINLDISKRTLYHKENSILLTQKESNLLAALMEKPTQIHSREELLWKVWSDIEVETGNVDNYIHFLRKRLRSLNCNTCIKTIYGSGYQLEGKI